MARERVDWVAVLDHGRVLGWITAASLDGHERVDEIEVTPFAVVVHPTDSLRHALDALVSSPTQVVIVVDADDRYLGLLDVGAHRQGARDVIGDAAHPLGLDRRPPPGDPNGARAAPRAHVHRGRGGVRDLGAPRRDRDPAPVLVPADQRGRPGSCTRSRAWRCSSC